MSAAVPHAFSARCTRVVSACNAHLLTFCSCAHCWQDIARSFNSLGIIDVCKDESICDAFRCIAAFVTVLFGAFDVALVCSFESFLNIFMLRWHWRGTVGGE